MSVLSRPAAAAQMRQPSPIEQYPLLGWRESWHRLPIKSRSTNLTDWLVAYRTKNPRVPWEAVWQQCQSALPQHFKQVWVVTLPRRSRQLSPGTYVFEIMTDFIHVPGNPPQCVQDCYRQAMNELPHHIYYLDLLWTPASTDAKTLLTPAGLNAILLAEAKQLEQDVATIVNARRVIRLADIRVRNLAQVRFSTGKLDEAALPRTVEEAQRVLKLSRRQLEREIPRYVKWDPILAIGDTSLSPQRHGKLPLRLAGHWD